MHTKLKIAAPVKLSLEEYSLILENSFANLFATDGKGKIIYANQDSVDVLDCPLDELLSMDVYQLHERGYVSHSMTDEALRTGKQAIGTYFNKAGREVATVSTPIFDADNNIRMVITYSRSMDGLEMFHKELQAQKERVKGYQDALDYLGRIGHDSSIIAKDPAMLGVFQTLKQIALTDSTVMLYGESGVGKEVLANYVRQHSKRTDEIYVPINCSTIPHDLIESELFGYEKGTFTGANKEGKAGLFELANNGTLFLDEIGELPLAAQSKLLRVMENGDYRRIGGSVTRVANVRIIGATNRDLKKMVDENQFRADLYYRLNVVPISVPPLRIRPLEIDAFADLFLLQFNRKHGKQRRLTSDMRVAMQRYPWPGNIRELRNVIERYVITGEEYMLAVEGLSGNSTQPLQTERTPGQEDFHKSLATVLGDTERRHIQGVMERCEGNVATAAGILGLCRSALYKKLKRMSHYFRQ